MRTQVSHEVKQVVYMACMGGGAPPCSLEEMHTASCQEIIKVVSVAMCVERMGGNGIGRPMRVDGCRWKNASV